MKSCTQLTRREFSRLATFALGVTALGVRAEIGAPRRHRFLCCDYQGNRVAIVSSDGAIEWDFTATTPQDCWMLPNGNVLFCHRDGAKEVSPKNGVVWEYKAAPKAQCHSCQPLPDGTVLVAECGLGRLVLIAQWWVGGLVTLARLLRRAGTRRTTVIRFHASIA